MRLLLVALILCGSPPFLAAQPVDGRFSAGVQIGVLDERDALGEKPAIAGGRVGVRLLRFLDVEGEINRFPIGGGEAVFPGTQFLLGAKGGWRTQRWGLFAKIAPGVIRYDATNFHSQSLGNVSVVDLAIVGELYSRRHIYFRTEFGDLVASYGNSGYGTRNQLQATIGIGFWL